MTTITAFEQLALHPAVQKAISNVGYETPSPIQAQTIPPLLDGRDVVGQAQTGTGKTAAFALPLLSKLDLKQKDPQVLVLAPTRELAIQVAEAFQKYAQNLKGFHVLPIYGGQEYGGQIRALKRGVHVVVGTPGRVMDHMRKGTLKLDGLQALVLDEADEMLRMGFIDDVEWILEQSPENRQIALFSATMPSQIRRIATKYLNDPESITIKLKTTTAETIRQRFWPVSGLHQKMEAMTRILEAEEFDAMIAFVRTKTMTLELSERLEARGFSSAPLNGDIPQAQRERTVEQLKNGKIDIVVATDVAARGLDVERISHVINYDIPYDTEAYVHRIGRTGRAGRSGEAILFVAPREKRMLHTIEKATRQKIELMDMPSTAVINDKRIENFKQRITDMLGDADLKLFRKLVDGYVEEHDADPIDVAAALARIAQGDTPLLLKDEPKRRERERHRDDDHRGSDRRPQRRDDGPEEGMRRYRVEVGHEHQVKPGNLVGAIANEAGLDSQNIGRINIFDDHSLVDLPDGMPKEIFQHLKKVWVSGRQLRISTLGGDRHAAYGDQDGNPARRGPKRRKPGPPKGVAKKRKAAKAGKPKRKKPH